MDKILEHIQRLHHSHHDEIVDDDTECDGFNMGHGCSGKCCEWCCKLTSKERTLQRLYFYGESLSKEQYRDIKKGIEDGEINSSSNVMLQLRNSFPVRWNVNSLGRPTN